jgi:hypothetical protein
VLKRDRILGKSNGSNGLLDDVARLGEFNYYGAEEYLFMSLN